MAHTSAINPVTLTRLLRLLLSRSIPTLEGRTIERIAMRRIPHPRACGCRRRACRSGKERLARRGRRGGDRSIGCSYGLAYLRLVSRYRGRRLYTAHLINPVMERCRPAKPDQDRYQKKFAQ